MLQRWTRLLLARRGPVLGIWFVALLLAVAASVQLPARLTNQFALPGTDSARAEVILGERFGQRTVGAFTLVARLQGDAEARVPDIEAAARRAAGELPGGRVLWTWAVDEHVVTAHIVSRLEAAQAKRHVRAMREAIGPIAGAETYLTGFAAIEHDLDPVLRQDLWRGEVLIALPICIVLLVWTFGTLSCALPLVLAAFTIPTALGLVFLSTYVMPLTTYVTNLVCLVGLGIAVDYSLLVVHRFREERQVGVAADVAIERTMATAGRAVVFSGTAVAIGLAILVLLPLPFLRGFGVGGLLIAGVSVLAAITLLPVLLSLAGSRLDSMVLLPVARLESRGDASHGFWFRHARRVMRHAGTVATATTLALLLMASPLWSLELGPGSNRGLPDGLESIRGLDVVASAVGAGATTPTTLVVDTGHAQGASSSAIIAALDRLEIGLLSDQQVAFPYFDLDDPAFVDATGRYVLVQVAGEEDFGAPGTSAFVERLRAGIIPTAAFPAQARVMAGGTPAAGKDFVDQVLTWFPPLVAAILAATYVLLLCAFRSLLLPAKAIVLNLLSIGAAYGLTVAAFSWGWGAPFGLIAHGQVAAWIPVLVFAMLFGLSMDYEVFLVSRMREFWDAGCSNEDAVAAGLASTGRLVTSAGLIMCAAFAGFVAGSIVDLQQFGFTLAVAILIDITLVRAWLLPASMKLFGRWNWYLPAPIARMLPMTLPARDRIRS